MRRVLLRIAPVLHLTRVTTAFAAVGNVWFVILWTRANPGHEPGTRELLEGPLWLLLAAGALMALGLFSFGACLNDILDRKRDRALKPDRPLPSGNIGADAALAVLVCTLFAAVLGACAFGSPGVVLTVLVAAGILVFNSAGRFIPGAGLVILGMIYAGHMLVPNIGLRFVWPVWLVMTHALLVAGVTHAMARKVPRLSRRAIVVAALGWLFWSVLLISLGWERDPPPRSFWPEWVSPSTVAYPAALALVFILAAWRRIHLLGPGPRAAEKVARYGALWLPLYACAWLFGTGHHRAGAILAGLTAIGLIGMTVLRELYALVEHPVGYRR